MCIRRPGATRLAVVAMVSTCIVGSVIAQSEHVSPADSTAISGPEAFGTDPLGDPPTDTARPGNVAKTSADKNRIFGVLPNYTSVEGTAFSPPPTAKQSFRIATVESFDPYVFPLAAATSGISQLTNQQSSWGHGVKGYGKRYAAAFADNAIGNYLTTAIVPTLTNQDPRYFVLGKGTFWHRAGYAASWTVVGRSKTGTHQFNSPEIVGNAIAAGISNAYYPLEDRTVSATVLRWGSQLVWDTLSNELMEFWPDIRRRLHKSKQ
jgi:hypothetical protein